MRLPALPGGAFFVFTDSVGVDNSPRLKPGDSRLNDHCLQ